MIFGLDNNEKILFFSNHNLFNKRINIGGKICILQSF